jgi:hypothetical protein
LSGGLCAFSAVLPERWEDTQVECTPHPVTHTGSMVQPATKLRLFLHLLPSCMQYLLVVVVLILSLGPAKAFIPLQPHMPPRQHHKYLAGGPDIVRMAVQDSSTLVSLPHDEYINTLPEQVC